MRRLAVEGPIGVGKTTLARKLADRLGGDFIADTDAGNPYLDDFYREPARYALHTQLHFLAARLELLQDPAVREPIRPWVADFLPDKDRLFAELTLDPQEWWIYTRLHERVMASLPRVDLVIYLQAPVERLIERIKRRGLPRERRIDSQYLQQLIARYERFFHDYADTGLLVVNAADINLADDADAAERVMAQIDGLGPGRHYFNPTD